MNQILFMNILNMHYIYHNYHISLSIWNEFNELNILNGSINVYSTKINNNDIIINVKNISIFINNNITKNGANIIKLQQKIKIIMHCF